MARALAGKTPITVHGRPVSVMVRPITVGSAPKRVRQKPSLSIATRSAAGASSSGRKPRPSIGRTPRIDGRLAETRPTESCSASPLPLNTSPELIQVPTSLSAAADRCFQSRYSG